MTNNYIYLKLGGKSTFLEYIKNANIQKYYNSNNILLKICRKLNILNSLFYSSWKNDIKKYDLVILGENGYSKSISKYIRKKNKKCKIVMYFWNNINEVYKKHLQDKNIDEFWTFDKNDAENYNMKYNPQFYTKNIQLENRPEEFDILFLGRSKKRKNEIMALKNEFEQQELKCEFIIIENEKDYIKYDEYLDLISKSKCILDYNQNGQVGLTLRPMEALFFNKKLITNNNDIQNYDFYNSKNIFILGENKIEEISKFINIPNEKIEEEIINKYDFNFWIEKFKK